MRRSATTLALSIAIAVATPAVQAAGPDAQANDVAAQVARLSSDKRAERLDAERTLSEGDVAVLDRLPQREELVDPAARLALERIRRRLIERRALQDAQPTLLAGDRIKSLNDLAAASPFVEAIDQAPNAVRVTLPDERLTLWEAVDRVAAQLEMWPVVSETIRFREREPGHAERTVARSGAFRFVASPIRLKEIAGSSDEQLARVTLDVQVEPKLRPLFLSYAADDTSFTADGTRLQPFSPQARVELPFGEGESSASFPLDFVARGAVTPPFDLTGHVVATVAAGEERFAFPLGARAAKRTQAGVTVERHTFEKNSDGSARVELSVVYDEGGPAFESHRTWVYHNHAYLTFKAANGDERATRLNHEPGFSTLAISSGGVKLAYRFANLPADAKEITFNYEAPTQIVNVPVTFEMEGLRLQETRGGGT